MREWSLKQDKYLQSGWKPNNNLFFRERFEYFRNIAMNRVKWDLKDSPVIETRDIEFMFFNYEYLGVWESEDLGYPIVTPIKMQNKVNFINKPIVDSPILVGDTVKYHDEEITWVPGDDVILTIALYCKKMQDAQTAIDQQIFNQKAPLVALAGSDTKQMKQKMVVETLFEEIKIMLVEEGLIDSLQALNLNSTFNVQGLNDANVNYENKILSVLGMDTTTPKRERLIVDEQEVNNETIATMVKYYMDRREKIAEAVGWKVEWLGDEREKGVTQNGANSGLEIKTDA